MLGDVRMKYSSLIREESNNYVVLSKKLYDWYENNEEDTFAIIWNELDEIVHFSPKISAYSRVRMKELLGVKWTILFTKADQNTIKEHFSYSNEPFTLKNVKLKPEERNGISFQVTIHEIMIDQKRHYACQFRSNTYIQGLEKMIMDSEKLVLAAQLSAGLVHEIRNPLTSLKGFLQLLQSGIPQKNEYYRVMIGEVEKLEKITSELLQMAKPFKHQMKMEALHIILEEVAFMLDTQSNMKDITLDIQCDEHITLYCNASQIKQILINLILNGAESMQRTGAIYIRAYEEEDHTVIDIIDEGEGVSPDIVHELEEPFFTTKEKGTGLGLVITKHLLDLHQSHLKVRENKSRGSTFTIMIPITRK